MITKSNTTSTYKDYNGINITVGMKCFLSYKGAMSTGTVTSLSQERVSVRVLGNKQAVAKSSNIITIQELPF